MQTEFKEKTYEKYFFYELARHAPFMYSPDHWDESFLGFDDAFLLPLPRLPGLLPYMRRRRWARMHGMTLSELERIAEEDSCRMPTIGFNLFVQYKRPEYIRSPRATEWPEWHAAYFRYSTTDRQQDLLEAIERQSHGRAATVYASPALWRATGLWAHAQARSVISQSNVASAGRPSGHKRYSCDSAGYEGKGHSQATELKSRPLKEIIQEGLEQKELPFDEHIRRVAELIEDTVNGRDVDAQLYEQARAAILGEGDGEGLSSSSLFQALLTIEAFSDAFDTSYYAMGRTSPA